MIFVALDIEKAGPLPTHHPIVSIGYCVGLYDGNILEKGRFNMSVKWPTNVEGKIIDYGDFDQPCWDRFWAKLPEKLIKLLQKNTQIENKENPTYHYGIVAFQKWFDGLEERYPEKTHKIRILSDNHGFDIGTIDAVLEKETKRQPIYYATNGNYRSYSNPDDMLEMLPDEVRCEYETDIRTVVVNDHDPANDAEFIYRQYLAVQDAKKLIEIIRDQIS